MDVAGSFPVLYLLPFANRTDTTSQLVGNDWWIILDIVRESWYSVLCEFRIIVYSDLAGGGRCTIRTTLYPLVDTLGDSCAINSSRYHIESISGSLGIRFRVVCVEWGLPQCPDCT